MIKSIGEHLCPNVSRVGGWHVFGKNSVRDLQLVTCLSCKKQFAVDELKKHIPFKDSELGKRRDASNEGFHEDHHIEVAFLK